MRILSPEKKYLYYLMISQLHEDGYTQQALQLEVSTIHSSGAVKASDKLSRLFSSCLSSVTEATAHFSSNKGTTLTVSGRKRHNMSGANIRAANLANLAKRRRTAGTIDSTSIFQDSIKKCVKLVTNDLQKATSDISSISPGPSPLSKSGALSPKQMVQRSALNNSKLQKSPAARQLFSNPSSSKAPLSSNNPRTVPTVSNSFLKGISLFKTSKLPSVTPYNAPQSASGKSPIQPVSPRSVTAQILQQQRMTSDSAAVVRVTKTNDPVIIDVEAPSTSKSSNASGLQLTQPRSAPLQSAQGIPLPKPQALTKPQQQYPLQIGSSHIKPVLTVGNTNASALKSLVNKISKRPVLSIQKRPMPPTISQQKSKSPPQVVVIDGPSPVKTTSVPTSTLVTTSLQRRSLAPELTSQPPTSQIAPTTTTSSLSTPPNPSQPINVSATLSALGLQPSRQPAKGPSSPVPARSAPSSPVPALSHLPVPESPPTRNSPLSVPSSPSAMSPPKSGSAQPSPQPASDSNQSQTNGLKSPNPSEGSPSPSLKEPASESSRSSTADETAEVKTEESGPTQPQIACVQCEPTDDQKYSIPETGTKKRSSTAGERSNASSDTDFPSEIFAEETPGPGGSNTENDPEKEPFKSPTSLSDALHAASDALLEQT
ncbi:uncharacterized protein LOC134814547 [Bolinopsis microptera]|uniref:uncharacterized protein LOC134814547 n=1 Tax=Bolinopsis microptera TaxID=2820187 RepID=UPI003078A920